MPGSEPTVRTSARARRRPPRSGGISVRRRGRLGRRHGHLLAARIRSSTVRSRSISAPVWSRHSRRREPSSARRRHGDAAPPTRRGLQVARRRTLFVAMELVYVARCSRGSPRSRASGSSSCGCRRRGPRAAARTPPGCPPRLQPETPVAWTTARSPSFGLTALGSRRRARRHSDLLSADSGPRAIARALSLLVLRLAGTRSTPSVRARTAPVREGSLRFHRRRGTRARPLL